MYADYEYYVGTYLGDLLTSDNAAKWLDRASDELDARTFGRLQTSFPVDDYSIKRVKNATCAVAESLYQRDLAMRSSAASVSQDGTVNPPVKSLSSGKESISYADGFQQVSSGAYRAVIGSILTDSLAGAVDANGVSLLYAGREANRVR